MHIHFASTFGFENVYPPLADQPRKVVIGESYLGLKGLLEWFELHLGLKTADVMDAIRISYYKKAAASALKNDPSLYFDSSFETDDWGTCKRLLYWRDELVLSQWNFKKDEKLPRRLYALASIENELNEIELPPGVNDRWITVFQKLTERKTIPLTQLSVYEPLEFIHPFFLKLFKQLESKGAIMHYQLFEPANKVENDLGHLQQFLMGNTKNRSKVIGDGSLFILTNDNEEILATALSESYSKEELSESLIILPKRGDILDSVFVHRGNPSMGYTAVLSSSQLDQLFNLVSIFLWKPIDIEKCLQFLALDISPIEGKLVYRLAQCLSQVPGIGSEKWEETIQTYLENKSKKKKEKILKSLNSWFGRKKYNSQDGVPVKAIIELYHQLANWANLKVSKAKNEEDRISFLGLVNQCQSLIELVDLEMSSNEMITALQVERWISSLEKEASHKSRIAAIGSPYFIPHHANVISPAQRVIWWNFAGDQNPLAGDSRWTGEEIKFIGDSNILSRSQKIDKWYWQLNHAIQMVTNELIICIPKKQQGEEMEAHPFHNDIQAAFQDPEKLEYILDLTEKQQTIGNRKIKLKKVDSIQVPLRKTQWKIKSPFPFKSREKDSYSSLHKLFQYPYQYVLDYFLHIKGVELPEISISPLLKGNLCHRIAEKLFKTKDILARSDKEISTIIGHHTGQIITEEGSIFLLPKNLIALREYKMTVESSLFQLINMIRSNGWKIKDVESDLKNLQLPIPLAGIIDLVLERGKEIAIVDLKWSGLTKRRTELQENRELQLLIYYKLLKEQYQQVHLAYYIVNQSKILARSRTGFAEAISIPSENNQLDHREVLWDQMINTYKERWKELSNGTIEVGDGMNSSELDSDIWDEDHHDFLKLPTGTYDSKLEDQYNPYKSLIGKL